MSVITYIYPTKPKELAIEKLLPAVRKKIPLVAISAIETKGNSQPNWHCLKFVHSMEPDVEMLFVVARKRKGSVTELEQLYPRAKELLAIRRAPILIWAQYLDSSSLPLKRFLKSFAIFKELIAHVADLADGVIDSPEHERLFSPSAFRRTFR